MGRIQAYITTEVNYFQDLAHLLEQCCDLHGGNCDCCHNYAKCLNWFDGDGTSLYESHNMQWNMSRERFKQRVVSFTTKVLRG